MVLDLRRVQRDLMPGDGGIRIEQRVVLDRCRAQIQPPGGEGVGEVDLRPRRGRVGSPVEEDRRAVEARAAVALDPAPFVHARVRGRCLARGVRHAHVVGVLRRRVVHHRRIVSGEVVRVLDVERAELDLVDLLLQVFGALDDERPELLRVLPHRREIRVASAARDRREDLSPLAVPSDLHRALRAAVRRDDLVDALRHPEQIVPDRAHVVLCPSCENRRLFGECHYVSLPCSRTLAME